MFTPIPDLRIIDSPLLLIELTNHEPYAECTECGRRSHVENLQILEQVLDVEQLNDDGVNAWLATNGVRPFLTFREAAYDRVVCHDCAKRLTAA